MLTDTDYFNVQALLWPGEEDDAWLDQWGWEAKVALLTQRRRVLERVFGNREQGRRMLDRFLLPRFLLASALRAAYDPEYLDGSLGYDLWSDLKWAGKPAWRAEEWRRLTRRALRSRQLLIACLARLAEMPTTPPTRVASDSEIFRALRVAVHNSPRLERCLVKLVSGSRLASQLAAATLRAEVERIRQECCRYSGRLIAIRMHHELTRLQRQEYLRLLDDLFDSCDGVADSAAPQPKNLARGHDERTDVDAAAWLEW